MNELWNRGELAGNPPVAGEDRAPLSPRQSWLLFQSLYRPEPAQAEGVLPPEVGMPWMRERFNFYADHASLLQEPALDQLLEPLEKALAAVAGEPGS
ncbi:MAG TPA: hypothetical protein VH988_00620 [Thermoanaerobaculia bacterium]|jgi:hypothetical protein|nr:hypothetical protein [Thermoanaerobaculia bacterium]